MGKNAAIILNGDPYVGGVEEDYIICADGGYDVCKKMRKKPSIIIGDLDSISRKWGYDVDIIKYPQDKDFTDGELCVKYCAENGIENISIYGADGGRIDHILCNIGLLKYAKNLNISAKIVTNDGLLYLVGEKIVLKCSINDFVSLVPYCDEVHIQYTDGLKYNASGLAIKRGQSIGISNVATQEVVTIAIESGECLVFHNF